jgi:tripartite-type tricarboxylate transporter receptor subunit TctC
MKDKTIIISTVGLFSSLVFFSPGVVMADPVADFFKSKPLTMFIGSGPGGGFDQYARILAKHYKNHIAGNPVIVVKNMPGASGVVAMNYLANTAPRDGSALLASFNTAVLEPLFANPNAKYDPRTLSWIGSIGKQTGSCLTMKSEVRTLQQAQARQSLMGATGSGANPVIFAKLMNAFLGTRFKIISGYKTSGLRLAIEKGEVEGVCGIAWETHMASVPHWIIEKKVHFIAQFGLQPSDNMKGVPLALDLIKKPDEKKIFELLVIPQEFGRPILGPPGIPADRLAVLQKAFLDTLKDPAYLADAKRTRQFVNPLNAAQAQALVERAYATPPELVKRAGEFTAKK